MVKANEKPYPLADAGGEAMSRQPAWSRFCARNMRGETIRVSGVNWVVQTHLRNGVWRAMRYTRTGQLWIVNTRLNFRGQPIGEAYSWESLYARPHP